MDAIDQLIHRFERLLFTLESKVKGSSTSESTSPALCNSSSTGTTLSNPFSRDVEGVEQRLSNLVNIAEEVLQRLNQLFESVQQNSSIFTSVSSIPITSSASSSTALTVAVGRFDPSVRFHVRLARKLAESWEVTQSHGQTIDAQQAFLNQTLLGGQWPWTEDFAATNKRMQVDTILVNFFHRRMSMPFCPLCYTQYASNDQPSKEKPRFSHLVSRFLLEYMGVQYMYDLHDFPPAVPSNGRREKQPVTDTEHMGAHLFCRKCEDRMSKLEKCMKVQPSRSSTESEPESTEPESTKPESTKPKSVLDWMLAISQNPSKYASFKLLSHWTFVGCMVANLTRCQFKYLAYVRHKFPQKYVQHWLLFDALRALLLETHGRNKKLNDSVLGVRGAMKSLFFYAIPVHTTVNRAGEALLHKGLVTSSGNFQMGFSPQSNEDLGGAVPVLTMYIKPFMFYCSRDPVTLARLNLSNFELPLAALPVRSIEIPLQLPLDLEEFMFDRMRLMLGIKASNPIMNVTEYAKLHWTSEQSATNEFNRARIVEYHHQSLLRMDPSFQHLLFHICSVCSNSPDLNYQEWERMFHPDWEVLPGDRFVEFMLLILTCPFAPEVRQLEDCQCSVELCEFFNADAIRLGTVCYRLVCWMREYGGIAVDPFWSFAPRANAALAKFLESFSTSSTSSSSSSPPPRPLFKKRCDLNRRKQHILVKRPQPSSLPS